VNEDHAIDAALLAFLDRKGELPLRERLRSAVEAHSMALRICPSCQGNGNLVVRSDGTVWTNRYGRPADQAVPAGQEMPCVSCDGSGVDLDHVVWACAAPYGHCRAIDQRNEGHEGCAWALRLPSTPGDAAQPG
jgi:DnaJ-class molecular chaperone